MTETQSTRSSKSSPSESYTYRNAGPHEPCPICRKTDWCWLSGTDNAPVVVGCKRIAGGPISLRSNSDGETYYLYSLGPTGMWVPGLAKGRMFVEPPASIVAGLEDSVGGIGTGKRYYTHERGLPEDRDRVYRALLGALKLTDFHEENLKKRGFSHDEIQAGLYKSRIGEISPDSERAVVEVLRDKLFPGWREREVQARKTFDEFEAVLPTGKPYVKNGDVIFGLSWVETFRDAFLRIPGFWTDEHGDRHFGSVDGMLVPALDRHGRIVALTVRTDVGKTRYFAVTAPRACGGAAGAAPGSHVHWPRASARSSPVAILTEGVLKADRIAHIQGCVVLGVPGVGAWRAGLKELEGLPIEHLVLAFDADSQSNAPVCGNLMRAAIAGAERGWKVWLAVWPPSAGKGLDDVLTAGALGQVSWLEGREPWRVLEEWSTACGLGADSRLWARRYLADVLTRAAADKAVLVEPETQRALATLNEVSVEFEHLFEALGKILGKTKAKELAGRIRKIHKEWQKTASKAAKADAKPKTYDKPVFVWDATLLPEAYAATTKVLHGAVYTNGRALVQVAADHEPPQIMEIVRDTLRGILSERVQFVVQREEETKPILPPVEVLSWLCTDEARCQLPRLIGLSQMPIIRPDGTVASEPGYDAASSYYLATRGLKFEEIPEHPSQEEAAKAYRFLCEPFCDFPWTKPGMEAVCIAAILQQMARASIRGAVPGYVHDGGAGGTGKTLQADVISLIVAGVFAPRKAYPGRADGADDEIMKFMMDYAIRGALYVCIDEVKRTLGGSALDLLLTAADTVDFRALGTNKVPTLPWRTTMSFTGVNVSFTGQMARRVLWSRVESSLEKPQDRTDFKHYPLAPWIRENRVQLIRSALIVLRAYFAAGKPDMKTGMWGSFEEWSKLIPGAIVYAGGSNLLDFRIPDDVFDSERDTDRELASGLEAYLEYKYLGVRLPPDFVKSASSADMIGTLFGSECPDTLKAFRDTVSASSFHSNKPNAKSLGFLLRGRRGRTIAVGRGRFVKIVFSASSHKGNPGLWSVTVLEPGEPVETKKASSTTDPSLIELLDQI